MKKTILFFALATSTFSFSQIKDVSSSIPKCEEIGKTNFTSIEKCSDNSYVINYRDLKFTQITNYKSFSFKDENGAFDFLYKKFLEGFNNFNGKQVTLELPKDVLSIEYVKNLGIVSVRFYQTNKAGVTGLSQWYTKKQIQKLFGRKEK